MSTELHSTSMQISVGVWMSGPFILSEIPQFEVVAILRKTQFLHVSWKPI